MMIGDYGWPSVIKFTIPNRAETGSGTYVPPTLTPDVGAIGRLVLQTHQLMIIRAFRKVYQRKLPLAVYLAAFAVVDVERRKRGAATYPQVHRRLGAYLFRSKEQARKALNIALHYGIISETEGDAGNMLWLRDEQKNLLRAVETELANTVISVAHRVKKLRSSK